MIAEQVASIQASKPFPCVRAALDVPVGDRTTEDMTAKGMKASSRMERQESTFQGHTFNLPDGAISPRSLSLGVSSNVGMLEAQISVRRYFDLLLGDKASSYLCSARSITSLLPIGAFTEGRRDRPLAYI